MEQLSNHERHMSGEVGGVIERLGFIETPDLAEARLAIITALSDVTISGDVLAEVWQRYSEIAEKAVETASDYKQVQIGALVYKALIFQAADNFTRYAEELDSADTYANNAGLIDESAVLSAEITRVVETLPLSAEIVIIRLRGAVDDLDREYLREQVYEGADLDDIVGNAYGMILEAGGDPDEVLKEREIIQ